MRLSEECRWVARVVAQVAAEGTQDSAHGPHVAFALSPKDPSQQMSCMTDWMAAGRPLYVVQCDTTVATVTVRNVTVEGAANSVRVLSRKDSHLLLVPLVKHAYQRECYSRHLPNQYERREGYDGPRMVA